MPYLNGIGFKAEAEHGADPGHQTGADARPIRAPRRGVARGGMAGQSPNEKTHQAYKIDVREFITRTGLRDYMALRSIVRVHIIDWRKEWNNARCHRPPFGASCPRCSILNDHRTRQTDPALIRRRRAGERDRSASRGLILDSCRFFEQSRTQVFCPQEVCLTSAGHESFPPLTGA
jgi:hypothetical protein